MLAALVLAAWLATAAPDWVEISQQHYRKPARKHYYAQNEHVQPTFYSAEEDTRLSHNFPIENIRRTTTRPTPTYIKNEVRLVENNIHGGDTVYSNISISEHNWNSDGIPRISEFKRVDANNFKIKANVTPEFSIEIYEQVTEKPEVVTRNRLRDQASVAATIERVPNKGSIKRVQLSDAPVKSPSITKAINPIRKSGSPAINGDLNNEFEITPDMFKTSDEEVPLNREKKFFSSTAEIPKMNNHGIISSTNWPNGEPTLYRYPQTQQPETTTKTYSSGKDRPNKTNTQGNSAFQDNPASDTKNNKYLEVQPFEIINKNKVKIDLTNTVSNEKLQEPVKQNIEEDTISNSVRNIHNVEVNTQLPTDQNMRHDSDRNSEGGENKKNEQLKANTIENLMKFMKVVAETISKSTRSGVNGKVKYLNDLKATLLSGIKERIDATWPDDSSASTRRRSRSTSARGHVEFPSSESALMTISFLTFAVFLIKLVLQVIHTYKNKAMMVAPLVVASAGREVRKLHKYN